MYILKMSNEQLYFGFTSDLKKRLQEHKMGKVFSTKKYAPTRLIYYECYLSRDDAKNRETMLKRYGSTYVHLKRRISSSIERSQGRGV